MASLDDNLNKRSWLSRLLCALRVLIRTGEPRSAALVLPIGSSKAALIQRLDAIFTSSTMSGRDFQVLHSLRVESRVLDEAWDDLLGRLERGAASSFGELFMGWCRHWKLTTPHHASPPDGATLGSARRLGSLAHHFAVQANDYRSDDAWRDEIREAESLTPEVLSRRWCSLRFIPESWVQWATFDRNHPADPFAFSTVVERHNHTVKCGRGSFVAGMLGTDPWIRDQTTDDQLVLLGYRAPTSADTPLKLPTVAEAYASQPWNPCFRPLPTASPDQTSGLTMPWDGFVDETPRPEVVHKPVLAESLCSPLCILTLDPC